MAKNSPIQENIRKFGAPATIVILHRQGLTWGQAALVVSKAEKEK